MGGRGVYLVGKRRKCLQVSNVRKGNGNLASLGVVETAYFISFGAQVLWTGSFCAAHPVQTRDTARSRDETRQRIAYKRVTNRIHVTDIIRALLSAMFMGEHNSDIRASRIYNLSDDLPESRLTVMQQAAELFASRRVSLNPKLRQKAQGTSPRTARRHIEVKLVSNGRLKSELLPDWLTYPTYVEGLEGIISLPSMPWSR